MNKEKTDMNNIDTVVTGYDSVLTDEYNRRVLVKYKDDKKIYIAEYSGEKLNGRIEIFDGQPYVHTVGHMKENKPEGIWLFVDKNQSVDSARIIHDNQSTNVDHKLFEYDTVQLAAGNNNFSVKKPKFWGVVSDNNNYNRGIAEPQDGDNFSANVILTVDTFAEKKDLAFAVDYLGNFLQKNYKDIKVINEGYYNNKLGTYYQLELEAHRDAKKLLIVASLFLNNKELYTLLGVSRYNKQEDYYLYSWVMRDIASNLSLR